MKRDLRGMVYRISQTEQQLLLAFEKPYTKADDSETLYNNMRIQEDKEMYSERVLPLFDEQRCLLSKDPEQLFDFID